MRKLAVLLLFLLCGTVLVEEAKNHIDKPYVYAAVGPNSFDCSGFVYYCVKESYKIELKRTACDQGYDDTYERISSIDDLVAGDLLYFNTIQDNDLCDHAGIYIGENQFIHASSGKGEVIISSLEEEYYSKHFSWGRRIEKEEDTQ